MHSHWNHIVIGRAHTKKGAERADGYKRENREPCLGEATDSLNTKKQRRRKSIGGTAMSNQISMGVSKKNGRKRKSGKTGKSVYLNS